MQDARGEKSEACLQGARKHLFLFVPPFCEEAIPARKLPERKLPHEEASLHPRRTCAVLWACVCVFFFLEAHAS